jgi:Na+-transporting NADH:ubiquinone oxidoreductase subunit A
MINIKKGLDLPLIGTPEQKIHEAKKAKTVAITGPDYVGMKPSMKVQVGDEVKLGQTLFECKKNVGLLFTSPAAGKVIEVNRGARRAFQSMVIEVSGDAQVDFGSYTGKSISDLGFEDVRNLLIESGLWTSLRQRPFSKVAAIDERPSSVFITAADTRPHAANPEVVVGENAEAFIAGAKVVSKLTEGKTYLCKMAGAVIASPSQDFVEVKEFAGKHPAGLVGTHMHFVEPVSEKRTAWHIGYQDVIAVGKLFLSGKLSTERVIALAGPQVKEPRLLRTQMGANVADLVEGELNEGETRVVSGSVLGGRTSQEAFSYLGRYHNQVSALVGSVEREFLGWHMPGFNKFSVKNTFVSRLLPGKLFNMNVDSNGSARAIVPTGAFESVMPLDILPTQLLRSITTHNTDLAASLGVLELDEEDLALCTFADSGKHDFGLLLRETLTLIEKEG